MRHVRSIIAGLIALALVVVPAHAGMYAAGQIGAMALGASDCTNVTCQNMAQDDGVSGMPMTSECPGMGGKKAMPVSACMVFCAGLIGLPLTVALTLRDVPRLHHGSVSTDDVVGHIDPPEPYPPKI